MTNNTVKLHIGDTTQTLSITEKTWNQFNDFDFWAYSPEDAKKRYRLHLSGTLRYEYSIASEQPKDGETGDTQANEAGSSLWLDFGFYNQPSPPLKEGKLTLTHVDFAKQQLEGELSFTSPGDNGDLPKGEIKGEINVHF